jgi:sugar phosphate isomerase/epimerase
MEKSFRNAVARLKPVVNVAKDLGIIFTIENDHKAADYVLAGYPEQVLSLIRNLDCKLTFDVGHANTLGKIESFLNTLSKDIVNVHLHNNNGISDEHKPLGKGRINVARVLEKVRKSNCSLKLTLECHSIRGLQQDYNLLKNWLEQYG